MAHGLIDNMAALVQIMAWHRTCDKPLSEPMSVCCTDALVQYRPKQYWKGNFIILAQFSSLAAPKVAILMSLHRGHFQISTIMTNLKINNKSLLNKIAQRLCHYISQKAWDTTKGGRNPKKGTASDRNFVKDIISVSVNELANAFTHIHLRDYYIQEHRSDYGHIVVFNKMSARNHKV